jgi:hypothetical protein
MNTLHFHATHMNAPGSKLVVVMTMLVIAAAAACTRSSDPSAAELTSAMNTYLAERGQLCLGKTNWPIDVTQHEVDTGARNALQMPVLERLGLASSSVADITVDDEGTAHEMKVRRYQLTDAGRTYYVKRSQRRASDAQAVGDFCAARLTLARVVGWDMHPGDGKAPTATVRYTYHVDAAPWTNDPEAQKVFPMVAGVVSGADRAELQESFTHTPTGWVAVDLQGS